LQSFRERLARIIDRLRRIEGARRRTRVGEVELTQRPDLLTRQDLELLEHEARAEHRADRSLPGVARVLEREAARLSRLQPELRARLIPRSLTDAAHALLVAPIHRVAIAVVVEEHTRVRLVCDDRALRAHIARAQRHANVMVRVVHARRELYEIDRERSIARAAGRAI